MNARTANRFQFHLDLHSGVPVYRQVIDLVRGGIASGALAAGDQLPTVRQLAVDLAINPNTVVRAYRELESRIERAGGGVEGNGRVLEAEPAPGERKPRLVDAFLGAEDQPVPVDAGRRTSDPVALVRIEHACDDAFRKRVVRLGIDADGQHIGTSANRRGAIPDAVGDAADDARRP